MLARIVVVMSGMVAVTLALQTPQFDVPEVRIDLSQSQAEFDRVLAMDMAQERADAEQQLADARAKRQRREFVADEMECLTDNIYRESAFEPEDGMIAVADVTINRTKTVGYPKTVCGVVYERHLDPHSGKIVCQFSWTCKVRHAVARAQYELARKVARMVYVKHMMLADLQGCTLYHAEYVSPAWAQAPSVMKVAQIGQHIFYKDHVL